MYAPDFALTARAAQYRAPFSIALRDWPRGCESKTRISNCMPADVRWLPMLPETASSRVLHAHGKSRLRAPHQAGCTYACTYVL